MKERDMRDDIPVSVFRNWENNFFFSEEITEESIYLGDDKFNFYKTAFEMPVNTHLELSR